ncbi:MAG: hypothetical protein V3S29_01035 [bacterium]
MEGAEQPYGHLVARDIERHLKAFIDTDPEILAQIAEGLAKAGYLIHCARLQHGQLTLQLAPF